MPYCFRWSGPLGVLCRICFCVAFLGGTHAAAQTAPEASSLRTFGYFQNSFQHISDYENDRTEKTFLAQQLNLFFQKDLGRRWTALVDFEVVNNFSSNRRWGSINLEEAWVRYRVSRQLNFKLGLHIPPFNNLNEIKNRTPLLPYIIRPYVYETSLGDAINTEAFLPARAFGQVYGFFPLGQAKLDYGVYVGNSPNINDDPDRGQTGADTSATYLVGGRVGVRYGELKAGVSATRDFYDLPGEYIDLEGRDPNAFSHLARTRLGADLSYTFKRLYLEAEYLDVSVKKASVGIDLNASFWYVTLGVYLRDRLFVYGSYWVEREQSHLDDVIVRSSVLIPTGGVAYTLNDMVTLKAQYAHVDINVDASGVLLFPETFGHFSTAVSVVF